MSSSVNKKNILFLLMTVVYTDGFKDEHKQNAFRSNFRAYLLSVVSLIFFSLSTVI